MQDNQNLHPAAAGDNSGFTANSELNGTPEPYALGGERMQNIIEAMPSELKGVFTVPGNIAPGVSGPIARCAQSIHSEYITIEPNAALSLEELRCSFRELGTDAALWQEAREVAFTSDSRYSRFTGDCLNDNVPAIICSPLLVHFAFLAMALAAREAQDNDGRQKGNTPPQAPLPPQEVRPNWSDDEAEAALATMEKTGLGPFDDAVTKLAREAAEVYRSGINFTFTPDSVAYRAGITLTRRALDVIEYELHQEEARELVRLSAELDILKKSMGAAQ